MAAAARYGTATFRAVNSSNVYNVDVYISDVIGASVNWDSGTGAGTGSLTFWKAPEMVVLSDLSVATGLTDTTTLVPTANGQQLPSRLRHANFINTITTRPPIQIGYNQGTNVGFIQA